MQKIDLKINAISEILNKAIFEKEYKKVKTKSNLRRFQEFLRKKNKDNLVYMEILLNFLLPKD